MRAGIWIGLAMGALVATTGGAQAHDSSVVDFFQSVFGGGNNGEGPGYSPPAPAAPTDRRRADDEEAPPLVVRRHRPHSRPSLVLRAPRTPREIAADIKNITIYTDKTLARGDVVMTRRGLRVFNGSRAFPHTDDDFVALSVASRMPPDISKELHAIDAASRIAER